MVDQVAGRAAALVAGATGLVDLAVVAALLADKRSAAVHVTSRVTRSAQKNAVRCVRWTWPDTWRCQPS